MTTRTLHVNTPKDKIAALPRFVFEGRIEVIISHSETRSAIKALRGETCVGFDTETRPTFTPGPMRPPALVQLSTPDVCFLFRLRPHRLYPELAAFLADPRITKVGLSLQDDLAALNRTTDFKAGGWIDLQDYIKPLGIQDQSLQKICANLLGKRISKGQQRSNWEADVLSEAQKLYAATDAYACLVLYAEINRLLSTHDYQLTED